MQSGLIAAFFILECADEDAEYCSLRQCIGHCNPYHRIHRVSYVHVVYRSLKAASELFRIILRDACDLWFTSLF